MTACEALWRIGSPFTLAEMRTCPGFQSMRSTRVIEDDVTASFDDFLRKELREAVVAVADAEEAVAFGSVFGGLLEAE